MADDVRVADEVALGQARYRRWWLAWRHVATIERAGAFVGDVGLALLFPAEPIALPSLWEAVAGADIEPFADGTMGDTEGRVWGWKDLLPLDGAAWYGKLLRGRASFLSPDLVALLYRGQGRPDDHAAAELSPEAHRLADALVAEPQPSSVLRELAGRRYDRAIRELQRALLVTGAGVREQSTGWPAAVFDLTCRRFDVGGRYDETAATRRFLDTVLAAAPADLARAFGWPIPAARARLDELVASGAATRDGARYVSQGDVMRTVGK